MAVVLLITSLCGALAQRLRQARVVGEIAGGILLGPSVFGRIAPAAFAGLFSANVLSAFEVLSAVGLVLYLFLIGMSMDPAHLRSQRRTAALVSSSSILLPLLLSLLLARPLEHTFAPGASSSAAFSLFLGVSLSITAFPVLARILEERGLTATPLGTTALLSAAVDDVCAWILLGLALAMVPNDAHGTAVWVRLLLLILYVAVMLLIVRPLVQSAVRTNADTQPSANIFLLIIAVLLLSAYATDAIGVHPLSGAFLAGLCFPRAAAWQGHVREKLSPLSTVLLPFFFALTGMRTRLDLLRGSTTWLWTGVIVAFAVAGKMGGALLASRAAGESWRNGWALAALLNTRGLVELVVLNIALSAGVFSPALFTMLVVMALATTAMTLPILNALQIGSARLPASC